MRASLFGLSAGGADREGLRAMNSMRARRCCDQTANGSKSDDLLVNHLSLLAAEALMPIRGMAMIALAAAIGAFIYVLRHLKKIERTMMKDNVVPAERGPRNNMVLIMCAIPIVIVTLLLFLIIKA